MRHDVFWLEQPMILAKDIKLIPKGDMTLEQQLNCLTRLIIFIYLILYLLGYQQSILFLLLSLIFIIILYYLQKSKMSTCEPYSARPQTRINHNAQTQYIDRSQQLYQEGISTYQTNRYTYDKYPSYFNQVERPIPIVQDPSFVSTNQALAGPANPKTRMVPIVAAPIYEWEVWKANDFVTPNIINGRTRQNFSESGYYTSPSPPPAPEKRASVTYPVDPTLPANRATPYNIPDRLKAQVVENFTYLDPPAPKKDDCKSCQMPDVRVDPQQRINGDFKRFEEKKGEEKRVRYSGDMIDQFGYDETNLQYGLPSNYPASNCQRNPNVTPLNDQIFTSTIVPGVYYKNEIIEPISSTIGISFDQQIPPRKQEKMKNGDIMYTGMDPMLYTPIAELEEPIGLPSTYDVYDPRSNGYGTSYRGYTDKMTGQARFYYDDIDAIRRPNYITRTNIDHLRSSDAYGPIRSDQEMHDNNQNIRETADNAFRDQTLDFRTEMMTRLMRKRNAELWQLRKAPLAGRKI